MHTFVRYCLYSSLLCVALPASSNTDIAGIHIADSYPLADHSLALNGAGIRSKFFFDIYIGVLYLDKPASNTREILANPGSKSMQMIMLYRKVDAKKIADGWLEGFEENLPDEQMSKVATRLHQFGALFPALKKGDHVYMDYVPDQGTTVKVNNDTRGLIKGADFYNALLQVWIGRHPADKDLKHGLLGKH